MKKLIMIGLVIFGAANAYAQDFSSNLDLTNNADVATYGTLIELRIIPNTVSIEGSENIEMNIDMSSAYEFALVLDSEFMNTCAGKRKTSEAQARVTLQQIDWGKHTVADLAQAVRKLYDFP